jgi:hypothetical protein
MLRNLAAAALGLAAVVAGGAAEAAQDLPITAFAGRYVGTGVARNDLSEYFALTVRDLDVTIRPRGQGFALSWTTVLREGGDPDNPKVKRKSTALTFVPAGRPGVFRSATQADPMSGRPYAWARIKGNTLTVHSLTITADGSYLIQTYDRTLTGFGMELKFTRVRDGETTRSVTGKLTKEEN